MTGQPHITLNDGRSMPQLGFGTWQIPNSEAASIVAKAIATGYRAIDTAAAYENETGVGRGLEDAGVPLTELFVTTKLANPATATIRLSRPRPRASIGCAWTGSTST